MKRFFPLVLVMLMVALSSLAGSYYWQEGEMVQGTKINHALDEKGDAASITTSLNLKYDKTGGALTGPVQVTSSTDSTFLGGGDVGIGTSTPNALLHVNGYFQASMPYVLATADGITTYTSGVHSIASFPNEVYDTHNSFSNSIFTAPVTGIYSIDCQTLWSPSAGGGIREINVFGGPATPLGVIEQPPTINYYTLHLSSSLLLTSGTSIYIRTFQNSGGDANQIPGGVLSIRCTQKF